MFPRAGRSALTRASKPPFRFRGCLYAKRKASVQLAKHSNTPIPPSADDAIIISELDRPSTSYATSPLAPTGLFRHNILTTPLQFKLLADATQRRAEILTERIVRARESREELYKVVKNLDRLSDMLCGVIDLAELIRNTHPDRVWVEHAEMVYDQLCQFMNVLNTHTGLYEVLSTVLSDPDIVKSLDAEARETALIFWRDFEKSGVNLPTSQREHFVSLSSEILSIGREFMMESSKPRPPAVIKPMELRGLKDAGMGARIRLQADATQRDLLVYPGSPQAQMIMTSAPEGEPRRKVYMASNSSTEKQVYLLDRMLKARGELARLVGKESYAAMALSDKMAKTPENVNHFLNAILDHTSPYARRALRALSMRKQAHLSTPPLPTIQAWDRDYYCPPEPPAPPVSLPSLTLGTVFMGLSRLFRALYGVTLRLSDVAPGEAWHSSVKKLEVVDEEQGILGWIYADLFARRGKPSGAAHYTVRCSRRTDHDDEHGDLAFAQYQRDRDAIEIAKSFDSSHRSRIPGRQGVYQLPLVVLVCEFSRPSARSGPTTLAWHEVVTLFHEMGHAMHSMIGRTEYQNVSGTRCATDFVELPSILMEHFLNSPTVLSLFDISGKPIRQAANHHEDPCRSIDTHTQILLAALDQIYHSPAVMQDAFNSTAALAQLYETRGLIPYVPGTSWQTQFGHLFGYGATYYSYLFDRAIASRVWRNLFSHDPLNRETGERFKIEILQHGGAKDPWQMVSTLLNEPGMAGGDAEAMAEVGRWKIEDEVPTRH